jgi:hypothetical protein
MISVKDIKPSLGVVKTNKPKILVSNIRPKLNFIGREQYAYVTEKIAYKGSPMGLLLALTYPVQTVIGTSVRL